MTASAWGEGYVVDIGYTHGYYPELSPALLRFVGILAGVTPIDHERPYTYYELGCGNGRSLILHAAANPHARFIGIDFNPAHIHSARSFAEECKASNVTFFEKSFAELVELDTPDAEFITSHGVWSWINEENRQHIVQFIRKRLQPGGFVYLSYNCLPGVGQIAPLQRLLLEHAKLRGGDIDKQSQSSIDFVLRLEKAGAQYFQLNPLAKSRLAGFSKQDPRYLVHEYFNDNWVPFYHADVARDVAEAKLGYIGSASLLDNFEQFILKPDMAKLIAEVGDRTVAETVKDFARNQSFRRDVFARGAPKATGSELEGMLQHTRFCLARPRSFCKLETKTAAGNVSLQEAAYAPVLDALARAPMTYSELALAPEMAKFTPVSLRQALFGMAALGNILPALPAAGDEARTRSTQQYNDGALRSVEPDSSGVILASPVLGAGIRLSTLDAQILKGPHDEQEAAQSLASEIRRQGKKLVKEGKPIETEEELATVISAQVRFFLNELLPWLRVLGIAQK